MLSVTWIDSLQNVNIIYYIQNSIAYEYEEIEKMFFDEICKTLSQLRIEVKEKYLDRNIEKDELFLYDYSFSIGISKDDFNKYFTQNVKDKSANDKLMNTIEAIYENLNKKFSNKKFTGYFYVQGYDTFFLSWRNYIDDYNEANTYTNTKVNGFTWDFDGEPFGDVENVSN